MQIKELELEGRKHLHNCTGVEYPNDLIVFNIGEGEKRARVGVDENGAVWESGAPLLSQRDRDAMRLARAGMIRLIMVWFGWESK